MAKKSQLKKDHNFTLEEIVKILESIISEQLVSDDVISYKMLLIKNDLYPQLLQHWEDHHEEVKELVYKMRAIREARYEEILLSQEHSQPTNLIWYGKACLKMSEEQHKMKLESDKEIADTISETIKIGYSK